MKIKAGVDRCAPVVAKSIIRKEPQRSTPCLDANDASTYAVKEINAFIAIRDGLLADAEEFMSQAKLDGVAMANDFVETCLKPARPPYQAQHLPETDATRERKRCQAVKVRLAELRAKIAVHHRNRVFAGAN
jgi:hypothetical protein